MIIMKTMMLICTHCKKTYSVNSIHFRCDDCNEPLELEEVKNGRIVKENSLKQTMMERYKDFYPFLDFR